MNWGLCYLPDDQALKLLEKIHDVLYVDHYSPSNGLLVCKETTREEHDNLIYHAEQAMHVRTKKQYFELFHRAGFQVVKDTQKPVSYGKENS